MILGFSINLFLILEGVIVALTSSLLFSLLLVPPLAGRSGATNTLLTAPASKLAGRTRHGRRGLLTAGALTVLTLLGTWQLIGPVGFDIFPPAKDGNDLRVDLEFAPDLSAAEAEDQVDWWDDDTRDDAACTESFAATEVRRWLSAIPENPPLMSPWSAETRPSYLSQVVSWSPSQSNMACRGVRVNPERLKTRISPSLPASMSASRFKRIHSTG